MRREDVPIKNASKNGVQFIIKVRCFRQDHVIHITYGGAVRFVSHHGMPLATLINEGELRSPHRDARGCYFFAARVLEAGHNYREYKKSPHKSKRTGALAGLKEAGVDDLEAGRFLFQMGERKVARNKFRYLEDEYPRPLCEIPNARINRAYRRMRAEQDAKLARVVKGLKEKGFKINENYYSINGGV